VTIKGIGEKALCVLVCLRICECVKNKRSKCFSSKSEDRLFRRLFRRYNQFIRPVENVSDPVTVEFEVSISQLVKVDEVNQIMETNLWLRHVWNDYKLRWTPAEYDGIEFIRVPSNRIWRPDIVLYNKSELGNNFFIKRKMNLSSSIGTS
uniref:Neurotransmitter-gated ion-channel ligand-binding domain-containing protein n=1 Tax=Oryzias latipes TaxID=8090 RepID=A0A3P9IC51_ORYLA